MRSAEFVRWVAVAVTAAAIVAGAHSLWSRRGRLRRWLAAPADAVHDAYTGEFGRQMAQGCGSTIDSGSTQEERIACINQLGLGDIIRIHPADYFWGYSSAKQQPSSSSHSRSPRSASGRPAGGPPDHAARTTSGQLARHAGRLTG